MASSEVVAVERFIQNVEEQIKAVEDRLEKEQDPDEKKYLRKKKEQLRKEKEQLREKELVLLKSTGHGVRSARRLHLLHSFWSKCRERTPELLKGYVAVPEWDELNGLHSVNVPYRKGLYVRKCFEPFLRVCLEAFDQGPHPTYVHVNGPPGIGKSAFLWYVVMMAGAVTGHPNPGNPRGLDMDVIVQLTFGNRTTGWIAFFRDGSVDFSETGYKDLYERLELRKDVLHLVDQRYLGEHLGNVMVFASPDEENTKDIDRTGGAHVAIKILPPWRTETDGFYELMKAEGYSREQVDKIVPKWGYVPRVVFRGWSAETDEAKLEWVIDRVALAQASFFVGKKVIPCRLFEMVPDRTSYEKYTVEFASDYLAQAYFDRCWYKKRDDVVAFVKASEGQADASALRGHAYEYSLVRFWSDRETTISAASIGDAPLAATSAYPSQLTLEVGKRKIKRYYCLADIRKAKEDGVDLSNFLWLPEKNNPLVDFLTFRPNIMGQATVSSTHSVLEQKLVETAAFMWDMTSYDELTFYLVVTPSVQGWSSGCLHWKNVEREERTHHDALLRFIGRYCAEYQLPIGPINAASQGPARPSNFKLPKPDQVEAAVKAVWKAAQQRYDSAKKAAVTKKRKLQESGVSDSVTQSEMEEVYSASVLERLGLKSSDEEYEAMAAAVRHSIVHHPLTWVVPETEVASSSS